MNKGQLSRWLEDKLGKTASKVLLVSIGVIFTAFTFFFIVIVFYVIFNFDSILYAIVQ